MNSLVVCGGTGAHVALAMVRLHTLGSALGFFRRPDGEPLLFPTLYLVDQDSGDGSGEATAWQEVRQLVAAHPGRVNWLESMGQSGPPKLSVVTPLPVDSDRRWSAPPYTSLGSRFTDSPYLRLLASQDQRDIQYSRGMMGSPAVGALLFRLKQYDTNPQGANYDEAYRELLSERGRVVVAGSAVGGTGASVAPTLACQLSEAGASVMAVMVLNWFRFETDGLDEAALGRVQRRNQSMIENANSAFAYYGRDLARQVATVPVGMSPTAIGSRHFTSDTQQPKSESYIHAVAALCCLHQFLGKTALERGLYQMGAEDPGALAGGTCLPGRDTLQSLADQAATLAEALDVFGEVLSTSRSLGWFGRKLDIDAAIRDHLRHQGADLELTGERLGALSKEYGKHVEWIRRVLRVEPRINDNLLRTALLRDAGIRERIARYPIKASGLPDTSAGEDVALALFRWTAEWIRERHQGESGQVGAVRSGYWPPLVGLDSLTVSAEKPGGLARVADQNVQTTVHGFVLQAEVTQNGWPHPIAAAEHFRYAIEQGDPTARRQLAMLLVGVVSDNLMLRDSGRAHSHDPGPSLERLIEQYRKDHSKDFACVEVVYKSSDGETIIGFNSPHTILCPVPGWGSDAALADVWAELSAKLTGSQQPSDWELAEMERWRPSRKPIRQIRSWIDHEKQRHGETSPSWTAIFDGTFEPELFGMGCTLSVYWGTGERAGLVEVALPTTRPGGFWPDESMELIDEQELRKRVPQIWNLNSPPIKFEMVEFDLPDAPEAVRAVWRDHLERLQLDGIIKEFGERHDERRVALLTAPGGPAAILDNIIILDRYQIMIREFRPLLQDPVPGSPVNRESVRYPDYPVRAKYFGLLQTDDGGNVLERIKRGERCKVPPPDIDERPQERTAIWKLRLRGRSEELPIKLSIPKDAKPHKAHWMVWPRFRAKTGPTWRAYYVYERCTDYRVQPDILWHDPDSDRVRRSAATVRQYGARPIEFTIDAPRRHAAGPPLALCARDTEADQELGLYLVQLDSLARRGSKVKVGIDFGTSHTIASVQVDGAKHLVTLAPELGASADRLTLHVSEDWSHVNDDSEGVLKLSTWLPTYFRDALPGAAGLLPSELLTIKPLEAMTASKVAEWIPGRDCVIPCMGIGRHDLADHVLADFKWECSFPAFRDHEPAMREIYLGMVTELVMADVCWRHLQALPAGRVDFTFTYPLRTQSEQVKRFQHTLQRVTESGTRNCGIELGLTDQVGIYNESSAAKGGTNTFGEVCLVADLGGGTLDLLISANAAPGVEFQEVADSAKLGGNKLLRTLAEHADRFLPKDAGWGDDPREIETKLRAWMRSQGSQSLFGSDVDEAAQHDGLQVLGFEKPAEANEARAFINRYFALLTEYLARSLVAFLTRHWYASVSQAGHDPGALRVLVELRGNGWRLRHGEADYRRIEASLARDVEKRAHGLWNGADLLEATGSAQVGAPVCTAGGSDTADPKAAPILAAVGNSLEHDQIRARTHAYALVNLYLLHARQADRQPGRIRWHDQLPFRHPSGVKDLKAEFRRIEPPFPLSHPEEVPATYLDDLETSLKRSINDSLEKDGTKDGIYFRAPVAPLVWETTFRSRRILGDE